MISPTFWTRTYWAGALGLLAFGVVGLRQVWDTPPSEWHRDAMRITVVAPTVPTPASLAVPTPQLQPEPAPRPVSANAFDIEAPVTEPSATDAGSPDAGSASEGLGMEGDTSPGHDAFGIVGRQSGAGDANPRGTSTGQRGGGGGTATMIDRHALERYVIALSRRLSRDQHYPRRAQASGWEGTAMVEIQVSAEARISHVALARSSGFGTLDDEALAKLRRLRSLPEPPEGATGRDFVVIVPIEFKLQ